MAPFMAAIFAWLAATASSGVHALRCADIGVEAPTVVTLMASPKAPATDAIVLSPTCSYVTLKISGNFPGIGWLSNNFPEGSESYVYFDRLESVPSSVKWLTLTLNNADNATAPVIDLSAASQLKILEIVAATNGVLDTIKFPPSLDQLSFDHSFLNTLPPLPTNLTYLSLAGNSFTTIDFDYPRSLTHLMFDGNFFLNHLGPATLPPALEHFSCYNCGIIGSVRGVAWPRTLTYMSIMVYATTEVEIRESDVAFLQNSTNTRVWRSRPDTGPYDRDTCSDKTANVTDTVWGIDMCVITDAHFETLYARTPEPSNTPIGSSGSVSGSPTGSDPTRATPSPSAEDQSPTTDDGDDTPSGSSSASDPTATQPPIDDPKDDKNESTDRPPKTGGSKSNDSRETRVTTSRGDTAMVVVAVVLSIAAVAALVAIGHRVFSGVRRKDKNEDGEVYNRLESPTTVAAGGTDLSEHNQEEYLARDIQNNSSMQRLYIEPEDLHIGAVAASSGPYVTMYGEYNKRPVAIKRLSMEAVALEGEPLVFRFMDEIRTSSTLEHPKIVSFIGVTWSCRQDIALVTEHLSGGDLHTLLQQQPIPASPQDWFQPWTASRTIKSKVSIARDVAEAVVYLHSFTTPIVHHDIKSRNVFLDAEGNAKLYSCGTKMASEHGTIAWIAPEVLRGEQYSEKVDIYSLGVLLVEMDWCHHPVREDLAGERDQSDSQAFAIGQLPEMTQHGPQCVKDLVAKCLSMNAADRPTAMEVHFQLRRMMQF